MVKGVIVATAEHPVTLTAATANVRDVCEKVGQQAFNGAPVCLLNSKNLPIQDVDGTKGLSLAHSSHPGMPVCLVGPITLLNTLS